MQRLQHHTCWLAAARGHDSASYSKYLINLCTPSTKHCVGTHIGSERRKSTANGRQDGGGHENVIGDRAIHWRGEGDAYMMVC